MTKIGILKPLTPDQFVLSVSQATGHFDLQRAKVAREQQDSKGINSPSPVRARFSRDRETQEFALRFRSQTEGFEASAAQALFMSYHSSLAKQWQPVQGNLVDRMLKQKDNELAASEAYRGALCREPTLAELQAAQDFLRDSDTKRDVLVRDFVWALVCSSEFRFNY